MPKYTDLLGQQISHLTVIQKGKGRYTSGGQYKTTWVCRCSCGKIVEVDAQKLKRGTTKSCGCYRDKKVSELNKKDIVGQTFGRLTVIGFIEVEKRETKNRQWLCQCECGNTVQVNGAKLRNGHTRSCGCLVNEHIGNLNRKYANVSKRLYSVYQAMLDRCFKEKNPRYGHYGGRGITVCKEWRDSFDAFYDWSVLTGYDFKAKQGECTLDRIDVNGNYEPSNCRWITNKEQQNNRTNNHWLEYKGETHTVTEWADILDIETNKFRNYISQGRTIEEILGNFKES